MSDVAILCVGLILSSVAAWYSIFGLMSIFSAAKVEIAIMGIALEAAKVITASWLLHNWERTTKLLRSYLTAAVIVLMMITSLGVFGYLSQAHIEQQATSIEQSIEITAIDERIARERSVIESNNRILKQLDDVVDRLTAADRIRGKDGAIATRADQRPERAAISDAIDTARKELAVLHQSKQSQLIDQSRVTAKVGPIKYVAEAVYGESDQSAIDRAVRWMIIIIVLVFDPLAVLLIVAANLSMKKHKLHEESNSVVFDGSKTMIEQGVTVSRK